MKEKQVIIMNGHPGSGKTTASKIIAEKFPTKIRSSIDYVKTVSAIWFDWDGSKTEENRRFLSNMKAFLNANTNLIEKDLTRVHAQFMESNNRFLIIDIREISEIKKYKKLFNAVTVFVKNQNATPINSNKSDAEVLNFEYDYTIENSKNISKLYEEIDVFIKKLDERAPKGDMYLEIRGKREFLKTIQSLDEVLQAQREWCDKNMFDSYYIRQWVNSKNEIVMDFGNHTTFFIVSNHIGLLD